MTKPRILPCVSCLLGVLAACGGSPAEPRIQRFTGQTMGSTYEVKFVGGATLAAVRTVVEEELAAHDLAFSKWRQDSEISRLNAHRSSEPFPVSPRFAAVLQQALQLAAASDGAFDPTVQPLLALFRAAKQQPAVGLDAAAFAAARQRVGYQLVALQGGAVQKQRPDVELDLDGLVAGACADAIAAGLDLLGVPAYYLEITGEVYCRGEKAAGQPWLIGVRDPVADLLGQQAIASMGPLRDRSLCTSGDYRNAVVVDGKRLHHVFDPRSGDSAAHGVISVSVLADQAAVADALGTALLVLGEVEGAALLQRLQGYGPLAALFLLQNADGSLRRVAVNWPADWTDG